MRLQPLPAVWRAQGKIINVIADALFRFRRNNGFIGNLANASGCAMVHQTADLPSSCRCAVDESAAVVSRSAAPVNRLNIFGGSVRY